MIDSPTIATEPSSGVDVGPDVTLPCDVASAPAAADRARLLAALEGLDPAGSVPVGWLISLLRRLSSDPTVEVAFDGTTVSLPQKVMTLRAVARRCGRSPGTVGTWQRTWRRLGLVEDGPLLTVNIARLSEACITTPPPIVPDTPSSPNPSEGPDDSNEGKLDVLLRHLRLAAAAGEDAAVDVIADLALRLMGPAARQNARETAHKLEELSLDRELERSLDAFSLPSTVRDARPSARSVARPEGSIGERDTDSTLKLLAPLLETVDRLGLAPLTDREALARALGPYSDEQVLHAQSVVLRQCNTQRNITSPIGLLVRRAQQGSPEYFELPAPEPPPEPPPPEDHGPPLKPEQRAAAHARARNELAKANAQDRRPVHTVELHTAA